MASAFLWRMEYEDKVPESFTDKDSLKERNRRFVKAISISFYLFLITALIITIAFLFSIKGLDTSGYIQFVLGILLTYSFTTYLGFVMRKIKKSTN